MTPRIRGGVYEFVVRQDHFDEAVYTVDGVIGGAHMIGGGTQGFISRQPDGTERFLPWDWSGVSMPTKRYLKRAFRKSSRISGSFAMLSVTEVESWNGKS